MTLAERDEQMKEEGIEEGKVLVLHDIGWTDEEISRKLEIPLDRVAFILRNEQK